MVLQLELLLFLCFIILIGNSLNLSLASDLELGADDDEFKRDDFPPPQDFVFGASSPLLIRWKVLQTKTGEPQASWTPMRMLVNELDGIHRWRIGPESNICMNTFTVCLML
ncbi:hypothetical protein ABKV19_004717 [Rosa sericea]